MLNLAAKQRIFPQTLPLFFYHSFGELNCKIFLANVQRRSQAREMSRLHGKVIRRYQNEMRARVVEEHRRQQETDVEAELNLVDSIAARNLILFVLQLFWALLIHFCLEFGVLPHHK